MKILQEMWRCRVADCIWALAQKIT